MNQHLTSKERVENCVNNNKVIDRPVIINPTSIATSETCRELRINFNDVHLDTDKMATLAAYGNEKLGFDTVMPYFSVVQEAAALGCEIHWGGVKDMPKQKGIVYKYPSEFKMPNDFFNRLPIQTVIDSIKLLRQNFGNSVYIMGKVLGPWTLSYHLHGVEDFLIETLTEPDLVHEFLHKFKEISIKFAKAQFDAGADAITIADHITKDLASPSVYKEYLQSIHIDILSHFKGKPIFLHCCGNTLDRIKMFSEAGFTAFHFDSKNNIKLAIKEAGKMKLTGCVNNTETLLNGTPLDVEAEVINILSHGIKLVSPECAIPLQVKNKNLRTIVDTVKKSVINI